MYTYDGGGNIQNKNEYAYTTGTVGSTPTTPHSYTYGDANWKDKLMAYDGKAISYDDIGNPTAYNGTYEGGRQLSSVWGNNVLDSYKYNDAGIRTQKINGTNVTNYHLSGYKVTYEERRDTAPDIAPFSLKRYIIPMIMQDSLYL